jgi:hypothetical protein
MSVKQMLSLNYLNQYNLKLQLSWPVVVSNRFYKLQCKMS